MTTGSPDNQTAAVASPRVRRNIRTCTGCWTRAYSHVIGVVAAVIRIAP
jgi:hypothetical protein